LGRVIKIIGQWERKVGRGYVLPEKAGADGDKRKRHLTNNAKCLYFFW